MARKIKVLLVDDHAIVRNGVRLMLEATGDIEVIAEAENADEALRLASELDIDVVLMDIALPGMNGLDLLKIIADEKPELAVLMFSMYAEAIYPLRALKMGAAGYLTKNSPPVTIVEAIRNAAAGRKHFAPAFMEALMNMIAAGIMAPHESLSERELAVFKSIAAGMSLTDIAAKLRISPDAVTRCRAHILERMDMQSDADLAAYALNNGF